MAYRQRAPVQLVFAHFPKKKKKKKIIRERITICLATAVQDQALLRGGIMGRRHVDSFGRADPICRNINKNLTNTLRPRSVCFVKFSNEAWTADRNDEGGSFCLQFITDSELQLAAHRGLSQLLSWCSDSARQSDNTLCCTFQSGGRLLGRAHHVKSTPPSQWDYVMKLLSGKQNCKVFDLQGVMGLGLFASPIKHPTWQAFKLWEQSAAQWR